MPLIPDELIAQLIANGQRSIENSHFDPLPVVKLFAPDGAETWLLTEVDPTDPQLAYGLCDLGHGAPELGYVRLDELATTRGRLGLSVQCDRNFVPKRPISECAREAQIVGRISA